LSDELSLMEAVLIGTVVLISVVVGFGNLDIVVLSSSTTGWWKTAGRWKWLAEIIATEVLTVDILPTSRWWKLLTGFVKLAKRSAVEGIER
jgi:hypothetical protein